MRDILKIRLYNTGLAGSPFRSAAEAVRRLGAVQAQDFVSAKWSLGRRMKNATESGIDREYDEGKILRIHLMRPTWHFVTPGDIRWILELTAPRIKKTLATYNNRLGLDGALFVRTNRIIARSLENRNFLTRQELKKILHARGIATDVQRLAHIISWAELDGLVCSGPRRGKQLTYALMDERVPASQKPGREESLGRLALKYFAGHGPAQAVDFSWWSGLLKNDANEAVELIKSKLSALKIRGKTYWYTNTGEVKSPGTARSFLLSIYDEYTIAYRDRSDLNSGEMDMEKMLSWGNAMTAVIILDGKVAGAWKRAFKKDGAEIRMRPFRAFSKKEKESLEAEAARYGEFFGVKQVRLIFE